MPVPGETWPVFIVSVLAPRETWPLFTVSVLAPHETWPLYNFCVNTGTQLLFENLLSPTVLINKVQNGERFFQRNFDLYADLTHTKEVAVGSR